MPPPVDLLLAARQHLAQTLGVPLDQILFFLAELVSCPDQDEMQASEGWHLVLYYQGRRFVYSICGDQIIPPQL